MPPHEAAEGSAIRTSDEELNRLRELADTVGENVLIKIAQAVCTARRKHPQFAWNHAEACRAVKSEMLEWESQALLTESEKTGALRPDRLARADAEAMDVIVLMIRYLNREWEEKPV